MKKGFTFLGLIVGLSIYAGSVLGQGYTSLERGELESNGVYQVRLFSDSQAIVGKELASGNLITKIIGQDNMDGLFTAFQAVSVAGGNSFLLTASGNYIQVQGLTLKIQGTNAISSFNGQRGYIIIDHTGSKCIMGRSSLAWQYDDHQNCTLFQVVKIN